MGPAKMHLQDLRELTDEWVKPLFVLLEKLWQCGEVTTLWKRRNITSIFKKENLGTTGYSISPLCRAQPPPQSQ